MLTAPQGVTILTTEEHADFFRAAIDSDIDFRIKPYECLPLDVFLGNVAASKGKIVVLDEEHFINSEVLIDGLAKFLDSPRNPTTRLQLIYVCADRKAGDALLQQLVSYFSIFDIVYGCAYYEIGQRALYLMNRPNRRIDVVDLLPPLTKIAQADTINDNGKTSVAQEHETEEIPNGYIGSPLKQEPKHQDAQTQNSENILCKQPKQDKTQQSKKNTNESAESPALEQTSNALNFEGASITQDSQEPQTSQSEHTTTASSATRVPSTVRGSRFIEKFEININLKVIPEQKENNSTEQ